MKFWIAWTYNDTLFQDQNKTRDKRKEERRAEQEIIYIIVIFIKSHNRVLNYFKHHSKFLIVFNLQSLLFFYCCLFLRLCLNSRPSVKPSYFPSSVGPLFTSMAVACIYAFLYMYIFSNITYWVHIIFPVCVFRDEHLTRGSQLVFSSLGPLLFLKLLSILCSLLCPNWGFQFSVNRLNSIFWCILCACMNCIVNIHWFSFLPKSVILLVNHRFKVGNISIVLCLSCIINASNLVHFWSSCS